MTVVSTDGLRDTPVEATAILDSQWAVATGTPNIIVAAYTPAITDDDLVDGLILGFRAAYTNDDTVVFSPNGIDSQQITVGGSNAPAGAIVADGEFLVRYNLDNEVWELLNPSVQHYIDDFETRIAALESA